MQAQQAAEEGEAGVPEVRGALLFRTLRENTLCWRDISVETLGSE